MSRWHQGTLNKEDQLFRRAIPHNDQLEIKLSQAVKRHLPGKRLDVLELGCGTGFSTAAILRARPGVRLTGVDNDARSLAQARLNLRPWAKSLKIVKADALSYISKARSASVDVVASKFTLHNFEAPYRSQVLRHIRRVLKPGGLFVNSDKYALEGAAHVAQVRRQMIHYLDLFLPLGRRDLLREALDHTLHDEAPSRVMRERQAVREMRKLGFRAVKRVFRGGMEAVYLASK